MSGPKKNFRDGLRIRHERDGSVVIHSPDVLNLNEEQLAAIARTEFGRRRIAEMMPQAFGFNAHVEKKEDMIRMAEVLWQNTYKDAPDNDHEAGQGLLAWSKRQDPEFQEMFSIPQNCLLWFALARWAEQAYPTVTMGEKFCAALMATRIPTDMLDEVKAPWKAFVIEVPGRMLSIFDGDAMQRTRITRIIVQHYENHPEDPWRWIALGEKGQHVWRTGFASQIIHPVQFRKHEKVHYEIGSDQWENDLHRDERLYVLISRLVLNVCLAVSDPDDPDMVKQVGSSHRKHAEKQREGRRGPPEQRVFQVGKPINLDCREAIQEYVEGERAAHELKIQSLVRGHYKRQAHGPKLSLRRKQWIMPYWRGPEDGPILTRPHVFQEDP